MGMIVLAMVGLIVWRVVRVVITKMITLAIIAALIGVLWIQRDEFEQCQKTCSCSLFGQEVSIPHAPLPSVLDGDGSRLAVCEEAS